MTTLVFGVLMCESPLRPAAATPAAATVVATDLRSSRKKQNFADMLLKNCAFLLIVPYTYDLMAEELFRYHMVCMFIFEIDARKASTQTCLLSADTTQGKQGCI